MRVKALNWAHNHKAQSCEGSILNWRPEKYGVIWKVWFMKRRWFIQSNVTLNGRDITFRLCRKFEKMYNGEDNWRISDGLTDNPEIH